MEARYRTDYPGEFVVLESSWRQGRKDQKREWIANPIENQHISGRAVCIGSSINQDLFDYTRLQRHRGGLLGTLKLQTYGVGAIAEQMRLDFTVEDDPAQLKRLIENDYYQNNVVYTTARNCINHPGDFYLIPLKPRLLLPALPLYLAAFDSHKEIFLIGYNKETVYDNSNWQEHVCEVMLAYSGVKFYIVGEPSNAVDLWLDCANVTTMPVRDFIGYCDV